MAKDFRVTRPDRQDLLHYRARLSASSIRIQGERQSFARENIVPECGFAASDLEGFSRSLTRAGIEKHQLTIRIVGGVHAHTRRVFESGIGSGVSTLSG
jgi:hypothetical protein